MSSDQIRLPQPWVLFCCHETRKVILWADAYYWCDVDGPWEKSGISEKLPIRFDVITYGSDKLDRKTLFVSVREAIGIQKGKRITERFAMDFFKRLGTLDSETC